jgi:hypothetical protein
MSEESYNKAYHLTSSPLRNPFTNKQMEEIKRIVEQDLQDGKPFTDGMDYNIGLLDGIEYSKHIRVSINEVFYSLNKKRNANGE